MEIFSPSTLEQKLIEGPDSKTTFKPTIFHSAVVFNESMWIVGGWKPRVQFIDILTGSSDSMLVEYKLGANNTILSCVNHTIPNSPSERCMCTIFIISWL